MMTLVSVSKLRGVGEKEGGNRFSRRKGWDKKEADKRNGKINITHGKGKQSPGGEAKGVQVQCQAELSKKAL